MSEPYRVTFVQDRETVTFYAWQVTRESAEDVAAWCGGRADSFHYINVDVPFVTVYDADNRSENAKSGDWVVKFADVPYQVMDGPVFQTLVHDLGATLVEEPRENFILDEPELNIVSEPTLNIVYDTPRHDNSVVYSETVNERNRGKRVKREMSLNIRYENGEWVNYRNGVKTVFGIIYSESVNARNRFKTNTEGES